MLPCVPEHAPFITGADSRIGDRQFVLLASVVAFADHGLLEMRMRRQASDKCNEVAIGVPRTQPYLGVAGLRRNRNPRHPAFHLAIDAAPQAPRSLRIDVVP